MQFGFGFCWGLVCKYRRFLLSGDKQVWVVWPHTPKSRHRQPRAAIQLANLRTPAARPETSPAGSGRPPSHPRTHLQNQRSRAGQEPPTVTSSVRRAGSRARAEVTTTTWHSHRVYTQRDGDRRPGHGHPKPASVPPSGAGDLGNAEIPPAPVTSASATMATTEELQLHKRKTSAIFSQAFVYFKLSTLLTSRLRASPLSRERQAETHTLTVPKPGHGSQGGFSVTRSQIPLGFTSL